MRDIIVYQLDMTCLFFPLIAKVQWMIFSVLWAGTMEGGGGYFLNESEWKIKRFACVIRSSLPSLPLSRFLRHKHPSTPPLPPSLATLPLFFHFFSVHFFLSSALTVSICPLQVHAIENLSVNPPPPHPLLCRRFIAPTPRAVKPSRPQKWYNFSGAFKVIGASNM